MKAEKKAIGFLNFGNQTKTPEMRCTTPNTFQKIGGILVLNELG